MELGYRDKREMVGRKWRPIIIAVFLLILVVIGFILSIQIFYRQKFFPGIKIGNLNLAGQTKAEVLEQLKAIEKDIQEKGLKFISSQKEIAISPITISATDPDLAKPILTFDWPKTVDNAWQIGREGNWQVKLIQQVKSLISDQKIPIIYYLDQEELLNILKTSFSEIEKPPINTQLKIEGDKVEVTGEKSGYIFNYQEAIEKLENNIKSLDFKPINLDLVFQEPKIKKAYTGSAINSLEKILTIDSIKIIADSYWWRVNKEQFIDWLEFQLKDNEVVVGFNQEKVFAFLEPVAQKVNIEAQDAKFELSGNRVTKFQASQDGKKLNLEESYKKINERIISGEEGDIELVVEVSPAKVATADINDLGIKELIGRGVSNFAGSPTNRRHNIAVGAKTLDGILIEPDEEFSLLGALGEVNAETGYKPELVIKGDRTIPEYGGGLCQIGTTTFRAALRSGLPITQRRPHSYRVVYYEPAGMDATIYDPYPDVKFINDTGYHILFTTKIEGNELIFEFYGTSDGREILIDPDPPSIFNITSPGEPRYIETDELLPGEKERVERSHNGADTYFKYTVTYPDGEVIKTDFNSHYIAWPEVWLVGREATTTEEIIEDD